MLATPLSAPTSNFNPITRDITSIFPSFEHERFQYALRFHP